MKIHRIVFSPTGGTQRTADIITEELGDDINNIDLTDFGIDFSELNFEQDDMAVIAVPSYGGRVPALAALRLKQINGGQARCVVVCVYGNRAYEDTLIELSDLAEESNFRVISAVAAAAEHSIIHKFAAGRPDRQDRDELCGFAKKILEKIKNNTSQKFALKIPGNRPYKESGRGGLVPEADDKCDGCGLCAEKCPAQAISKENIKITDSEKCIHCMRCVVKCPRSARKVNEAAVSAVENALSKVCSERKNNELYI
ncbi:MAG: 4Fe-4S binding protein [Clostridiales bacterium]|nr:4Fe-4S binding protein [Clostridiales bacterium]